jgi:hypothetical protein
MVRHRASRIPKANDPRPLYLPLDSHKETSFAEANKVTTDSKSLNREFLAIGDRVQMSARGLDRHPRYHGREGVIHRDYLKKVE